jgi:anti-sigma B factor antagonist
MKLHSVSHKGVVELAIEGNVLQENVGVFKKTIADLISEGKIHIILNMGDTAYISSMCLAVLIDAKSKLSNLNGDLKIAVVNRLVRNLMEITNLVKKIEVYDSIEAAVESFQ